jgi:hypothetical protein
VAAARGQGLLDDSQGDDVQADQADDDFDDGLDIDGSDDA